MTTTYGRQAARSGPGRCGRGHERGGAGGQLVDARGDGSHPPRHPGYHRGGSERCGSRTSGRERVSGTRGHGAVADGPAAVRRAPDDPSTELLRPPRRFPELVGIMPGSTRAPGLPRVMAVIDTSGSIAGHLLAQIARELAWMAASHEVVIVSVSRDPPELPFRGRVVRRARPWRHGSASTV